MSRVHELGRLRRLDLIARWGLVSGQRHQGMAITIARASREQLISAIITLERDRDDW